jgi:hypothetical protein
VGDLPNRICRIEIASIEVAELEIAMDGAAI